MWLLVIIVFCATRRKCLVQKILFLLGSPLIRIAIKIMMACLIQWKVKLHHVCEADRRNSVIGTLLLLAMETVTPTKPLLA